MLLKIREKSQGVFAWVILILICVPFALWGIQNYVGGGSENAIASVGDKDFFQQDWNQAYSQYSQSMAGKNFDEKLLKKQALEKLISDEVLLQHAENENLVVTDGTAKKFIQTLEYFKTDGKFDNKKFKSLLGSQQISSGEFVNRVKKALVMEQFQKSVTESGFATQKEIEGFFRIQNQKRNVEIISVGLEKVKEQPTEQEVENFYQQNQNTFLTEEQASIEYVELSLDNLAKKIEPTNEQLQTYYDENKEQYTTKERRKISHILFAFNKDVDEDKKQLERALNAKKALKDKTFSDLAAELSDDKVTASKGGDLGLFNAGVMEKAFEDAASSLKLGEVSEPVKSAFGYHLIKVTELVESKVGTFDSVKEKVTTAYQRTQAEKTYYELGESLTELAYENPDSLIAVADEIGVDIKKTPLFGKNIPVNTSPEAPITHIYSDPKIVSAAFSEDVLKGNNSEPIELGSDKLVVIRTLQHQPAKVKELAGVKKNIVETLLNNKAKKIAMDKAEQIKQAVLAGKSMDTVAKENGYTAKKLEEITRSKTDLAWQVSQAIFKAAKPLAGKTTVITVAEASGAQSVINLLSVTDGVMTKDDKAKQDLAKTNMAKAFGQAEFAATLESLRANANVKIKTQE